MLKAKRVRSDEVFLREESNVKLKTAGTMREVVLSLGVDKKRQMGRGISSVLQ